MSLPFYVYAWIGAIASGLLVITAKLTSKYSISNPWLFNFLLTLATLIFTIPMALLNNATMPTNWIPIIIAAIFSVLFNIFWIFSTYALDVSVLTPLFNFRGVFAVLIGSVFLKEVIPSNSLIFVVIILLSGVFTSMDEKFNIKTFFTRNIFIGLLTVLFLAINNSLIKVSLAQNSLWTTNLWSSLISVVLLLVTFPKFTKDLKNVKPFNIFPIAVMGIFSTVTELTANAAYGVNVGISSLIMNVPFSMVFAFVLSIFLPKLLEKHTFKVYAIRFTATAIMIFCSLKLSGM